MVLLSRNTHYKHNKTTRERDARKKEKLIEGYRLKPYHINPQHVEAEVTLVLRVGGCLFLPQQSKYRKKGIACRLWIGKDMIMNLPIWLRLHHCFYTSKSRQGYSDTLRNSSK
jgi:hypothetical protein